MTLLGAVLAWLVLSHSLVAYLARTAPEIALLLSSHHPEALSALAENAQAARLMAAQRTKGEAIAAASSEPIRSQALTALRAAPLSPDLLRILGQIADEDGQPERALTLMTVAERLSRRDTQAILWLLKHSYEQRDWKGIVSRSDVLLRTQTAVQSLVVPALARVAEDPLGIAELQPVLAANPPWRSAFFQSLPENVADWRTPLNLLEGLKFTATPPTQKDYRPYISFLIGKQRFDIAYYAWLQSLPAGRLAEVGLLYNGAFKYPLTDMPFDWVIQSGPGSVVEVHDFGAAKALVVQFSLGRVQFGGVSQITLLAPGSYVFSGTLRGDLTGRRGLEWQISCSAVGGKLLGQSPMFLGNSRGPRPFEVTFDVPVEGCSAQHVRLIHAARSASEQMASGTVYYEDLSIVPNRPSTTNGR